MQLVDDHGRVMDAEYLVEGDGDYLALIMESRGGSPKSPPVRNPDYNPALTILLTRLGEPGQGTGPSPARCRRTWGK